MQLGSDDTGQFHSEDVPKHNKCPAVVIEAPAQEQDDAG